MQKKDPVPAGVSPSRIKRSLDRLYRAYGADHLHSDPLQFAHAYSHPADREVAGFLSAVFAYGQVPQILATLENLFSPFPERITPILLDTPTSRWQSVYPTFSYRFQTREDLVQLLGILKGTLLEYGSLENSFLPHYLPVRGHPEAIRLSLTGWVGSLRNRLPARSTGGQRTPGRGISHLLADPASGSPCKRWNLYLRWMIRGPDGMDLGLWKSVDPRQLILPLDTHTARISRYLGFTRRSTPTWAMAEEVTRALRGLDPDDPVRYDFSMARLGILSRCSKRAETCQCKECELEGICHREDRPLPAASGPGREERGTPRRPK